MTELQHPYLDRHKDDTEESYQLRRNLPYRQYNAAKAAQDCGYSLLRMDGDGLVVERKVGPRSAANAGKTYRMIIDTNGHGHPQE